MPKTIVIPEELRTLVTSIDSEGNESSRTAIKCDDGSVIDSIAEILIGEPIEEQEGPDRRLAYVDDRFSDAALDTLKDKIESAEIRNDLPEDWRANNG